MCGLGTVSRRQLRGVVLLLRLVRCVEQRAQDRAALASIAPGSRGEIRLPRARKRWILVWVRMLQAGASRGLADVREGRRLVEVLLPQARAGRRVVEVLLLRVRRGQHVTGVLVPQAGVGRRVQEI